MQAVHEMLLQTWSPQPGRNDPGVIRIFPAMPWRWHHASYTDLRAESGHRVSARRQNNATTWFRIVAGADGEIRIRDNFASPPRWSRRGVEKIGNDFVLRLKRGQALEADFAVPSSPPPAPANAAAPVQINSSPN
jgi:alpha-L-fucosidase 2